MEWKPVVYRQGQYEVSRCGKLRTTKGKIVGQWLSNQGYALARFSNPRQTVRVHRVVAEAFCENPKSLPYVNHIDCVRSNNSADNLEWCTQWQNLMHSQSLGRMQRDYWKGKRSPNAKLTEQDIVKIREAYAQGGISWESLGKRFSISKRSIGRIINGESYV